MKQVIIVDASLNLPKGKLAAQVAHAAVAAFLAADDSAQQAWLDAGMPKVVLRAEGPGALNALYELAEPQGLPAALIHDAGRTVLPAGTVTCLGLGPAAAEQIDALTGELKLLR